MNPFVREDFEAIVSGLPGAEIVHQWGHASVGKVGGKIFALFAPGDAEGAPAVSFKCSEISFALLTELDGVIPAPYLARAKWVRAVQCSAMSVEDVRAYIVEAHRLIGANLPKREQARLGLNS